MLKSHILELKVCFFMKTILKSPKLPIFIFPIAHETYKPNLVKIAICWKVLEKYSVFDEFGGKTSDFASYIALEHKPATKFFCTTVISKP